MNRLMIIGCSGSGKSTLARSLGKITGLPVYHLDALYWKPGWVPTPNVEWDELQSKLVKKEKWIIDGNYGRTVDIRMAAADTIIFFDLPTYLTMYRVIKRRYQYRNKSRPDLTKGCQERLDVDFLKWVWDFRRKKRPDLLKKLRANADDKRVIILNSRRQVGKLIEQFEKEI